MSLKSDYLGNRMKTYEAAYKQALPCRLPVIVRADGKAFHTYTKGLKKTPGVAFDENLEYVMNLTAIKLCEEIQGAQLAYIQSDEISILVHGYKKLTSQGWFNNELQKIVSVSAAIASATFTAESWRIWGHQEMKSESGMLLFDPIIKPAYFDSRAFILPESEVCNAYIWRQQDAIRNSLQMLTRSLYSHKECNNKNTLQLQSMCLTKGRDWNNEPASFKRGRCVIKTPEQFITPSGQTVTRWKWSVDNDIPVFSKERHYIEQHLSVEEE